MNIFQKQKFYWDNRNEIVLCLGVNSQGYISWSRSFSWNEKKIIEVNLREDIQEIGFLGCVDDIIDVLNENILKYHHWRDFEKDFNYLTFEPSGWQMFWIGFISMICTIIPIVIYVYMVHIEDRHLYYS